MTYETWLKEVLISYSISFMSMFLNLQHCGSCWVLDGDRNRCSAPPVALMFLWRDRYSQETDKFVNKNFNVWHKAKKQVICDTSVNKCMASDSVAWRAYLMVLFKMKPTKGERAWPVRSGGGASGVVWRLCEAGEEGSLLSMSQVSKEAKLSLFNLRVFIKWFQIWGGWRLTTKMERNSLASTLSVSFCSLLCYSEQFSGPTISSAYLENYKN